MQLTVEEQDILSGEHSAALQKALTVLMRYGEAFGARDFARIQSAHLVASGGCFLFSRYIRFLRDVAADGLQVSVPTTLNPRPFDPGEGSFLQRLIFARQRKLESLSTKLGCDAAYTCTPYLDTNSPSSGDALAWAESSAVAYANSVLGARTNQTPAMIELCSGLLGRTPRYGLLLQENRRGTHLVTVQATGKIDYGILGYVIAQELVSGVPVIEGIQPTVDEMKTLGASLGAAGAIALFHVMGVTPEARALDRKVLRQDHRRLRIRDGDLQVAARALRGDAERFSHVIVGCPHLSSDELGRIAAALSGRRLRGRLWLLACGRVRRDLADTGTDVLLRDSGAQLKSICPIYFHDTPRLICARVLTDSVKLAHHTGCTWAPREECLGVAEGVRP